MDTIEIPAEAIYQTFEGPVHCIDIEIIDSELRICLVAVVPHMAHRLYSIRY